MVSEFGILNTVTARNSDASAEDRSRETWQMIDGELLHPIFSK